MGLRQALTHVPMYALTDRQTQMDTGNSICAPPFHGGGIQRVNNKYKLLDKCSIKMY